MKKHIYRDIVFLLLAINSDGKLSKPRIEEEDIHSIELELYLEIEFRTRIELYPVLSIVVGKKLTCFYQISISEKKKESLTYVDMDRSSQNCSDFETGVHIEFHLFEVGRKEVAADFHQRFILRNVSIWDSNLAAKEYTSPVSLSSSEIKRSNVSM